MQKTFIAFLSLAILSSCGEKKQEKDLLITGNIKGLKKGTLYIQKLQDTTLVALDTIKINGDSHFTSELDIDSPEMYYLFLDRGVTNSLDNNIPFFAEKGKGAYLNNRKLSVSTNTNIESACLVTGFPYKWATITTDPIPVFERFIRKGLPVRRLGSAAIDLCWVAAGRFDGFWEYNLNPWDIAAGYLIVEEAGGRISNFKGEPYDIYDKETLATNGKIHEDMLVLINA